MKRILPQLLSAGVFEELLASAGFFVLPVSGIGVYSNLRESIVIVTGPSLVSDTLIIAPNWPSSARISTK